MAFVRDQGGAQARRGRGARLPSRASRRDALRTAGRAGFTARGVVYVLVGVLAVAVALGRRPGPLDRQGALHQIASHPFGAWLLWALTVGFGCMALWRASLAVGDRDRKAGERLLHAGGALFYSAACWGTAAYATGVSSGAGSDAETQDWTASALKLPGGQALVVAAGVVLAGVGIAIVVSAVRRRFLRELDTAAMSRRTREVVSALGVGGNVARGTVWTAAGVFVLTAAVDFDPRQAKGMDATLRSFAGTPAGPWLLVLVAAGLMLFGGFSFASARWRRL